MALLICNFSRGRRKACLLLLISMLTINIDSREAHANQQIDQRLAQADSLSLMIDARDEQHLCEQREYLSKLSKRDVGIESVLLVGN